MDCETKIFNWFFIFLSPDSLSFFMGKILIDRSFFCWTVKMTITKSEFDSSITELGIDVFICTC